MNCVNSKGWRLFREHYWLNSYWRAEKQIRQKWINMQWLQICHRSPFFAFLSCHKHIHFALWLPFQCIFLFVLCCYFDIYRFFLCLVWILMALKFLEMCISCFLIPIFLVHKELCKIKSYTFIISICNNTCFISCKIYYLFMHIF